MANAERSGISNLVCGEQWLMHLALQILHKDFLSQKKQWENDLARSAPQQAAVFDEGDEVTLGSNNEGTRVNGHRIASKSLTH